MNAMKIIIFTSIYIYIHIDSTKEFFNKKNLTI